ncbi:hypothetical protein [Alkalibacillus salilacus]|uniref:Hemerythrin-like domain-containing protein n=1 Tax=Alkalibacillus salilacus TaxID=284582 RepID=A0ABT9VBE6_9BACI|nr:hypothetical protein [Alkalibacillus salilacus]MDQ0158286.1 hemerythrin-like domain-containing protein [Alkalibacillus salilacus]
MTGPALRKQDSHHAIHEGARAGAIAKTEELIETIQKGDQKATHDAALDLIDFWETRIIAHADAEEEEGGLYAEIVKEQLERQEDVTKLTRDHDLLRQLVQQIKDELNENGFAMSMIDQFNALVVINEMHSRDEEGLLHE